MDYLEFTKRFATVRVKRRLMTHCMINDLGLFHGQPPIMEYIAENDGCTQFELANALSITPSSVAVSTKRLEKAGMISKETDADNLRCKRLHVTERGRETTLKSREIMREADEKMFKGFSEEEFSALCGYFDRIIANLSDGKSEPLEFFDTVALSNQIMTMHVKNIREGKEN